MAAGGPGDHPLTDVLNYDIQVYGNKADKLLKKLGMLLSRTELEDFWESEIGWNCENRIAFEKIIVKYNWAKDRANKSGWEL